MVGRATDFGRVPAKMVSDNVQGWRITKFCFYEAAINRRPNADIGFEIFVYLRRAGEGHASPNDKAYRPQASVLLAERWIVAPAPEHSAIRRAR